MNNQQIILQLTIEVVNAMANDGTLDLNEAMATVNVPAKYHKEVRKLEALSFELSEEM